MADVVVAKRCSTCKTTKPARDFCRSASARDGLQPRCRDCQKVARTSPEGRASARAATLRYLRTENGRAKREAYQKSAHSREYQKKYGKRYYQEKLRSTTKQRAWDAVHAATRRGRIPAAKELSCRLCGLPATTYHHLFGYDRDHWFDIIPVCTGCHQKLDHPTTSDDINPGSACV